MSSATRLAGRLFAIDPRSLERLFAIDLRSLGALRIALAGILLFDLLDRSRHLTAFYTDAGVLPGPLARQFTRGLPWSLHTLASPWPGAEAALFAVQVAAAVALLLGWRTRLATAASWLLLASIHQRPLLTYSGGDHILRALLFWGMFLPLGARFSLDARGAARGGPERVLGVASAALLLQVGLVYWVNTLEKLRRDAWLDGTAVGYALELSFFRGPLAPALQEYEALLPLGTWLTLVLEGLGPLLAFSPVWTGRLRLAAVGLFAGFHVGLAGAFSLGIFPPVCAIAWLPFLPGGFWRALAARSAGAPAGPRRPPARVPPALEALAGAAFLYVALSLGAGLAGLALPRPLALPGQALLLHQTWAQFADVGPVDSWLEVRGVRRGGDAVDPLRGGPELRGSPAALPAAFPSFAWRIYYFGLVQRALARGSAAPRALYAGLAEYFCRDWNARHRGGAALERVRIAAVAETAGAGRVHAPREHFVHEQACPAP